MHNTTDADRFEAWVEYVSELIPEPTDEELDDVYAKPCRYRRAALASRA